MQDKTLYFRLFNEWNKDDKKKRKLSLFYRLYYIIEKETTQMKINFYSNSNIENWKKRRMRILSTVSFLAGKFATFEQMLLTKPINFFRKTERMRTLSVRIKLWRENYKFWISVTMEKREQKNNISVLNSSWISSKQAQNCKKDI